MAEDGWGLKGKVPCARLAAAPASSWEEYFLAFLVAIGSTFLSWFLPSSIPCMVTFLLPFKCRLHSFNSLTFSRILASFLWKLSSSDFFFNGEERPGKGLGAHVPFLGNLLGNEAGGGKREIWIGF